MTTLQSLTVLFILAVAKIQGWGIKGNPLGFAHPCKNNDNITARFEAGLSPDEENQYHVSFSIPLPKHSAVQIKFDSPAIVTLDPSTKDVSRISVFLKDTFSLSFFNETPYFGFQVKGKTRGVVPYMTKVLINEDDFCTEPYIGFLDGIIQGYKDTAETDLSVPDNTCGRRQVEHTELIVNGYSTKPGDWPWHAAIYRLDAAAVRYICGGTLISKNVILTAAHCATIRGSPVSPEILSVVLGKYNLIGGDVGIQEREIHSIVVHEDFVQKHLENDIALLKLKSEVKFDEYVQPACLWSGQVYNKLPKSEVDGTVVGWGFDQSDSLSSQLHRATMPIISQSKCIKSNPLFYASVLTDHKFCAGYANGTSACNGDSGGGFMVFVPDIPKDSSPKAPGIYYVRGIVSLSASRKDAPLCDPEQYVVFTDVALYRHWVMSHMDG